MPIQEKNFTFELTASLMMWNGGKDRDVIKCPAELADIFGVAGEMAHGYLTHEHGAALRKWVDGAQTVDNEVKRARDSLQMVCEQGMQSLQEAWAALPKEIRKQISASGCPDDLKKSAQAFDEQRAAAANDNAAADDLNNALLGSDATEAA